ncbi:MAG: Nitrate reductase [Rhodocyclaceae bacterium]|nr:Nitrate reductase [Rhodocyclaceae bacterium]
MNTSNETTSTCCYCGTGCGVRIVHSDARVVDVKGDTRHPANFGRLCTKGSTLHLSTRIEGRALYPELRTDRHATRMRTDWESALEHCAERMRDILRRHGPNSVAFYVSGQLLTEDYYVFNKLAKGLIGTNNIDSNSRLCMSSAVAGYKATLGADAPPCAYEDIDHTDLLLIAGANPAYAHPVLFRRIEEAKAARPDLRLIVVDPRRTYTAQLADLHLAIAPGTDIVLYGAMLNRLIWEGRVDRAYIDRHTEGFDALREQLRELTPGAAARICGVDEAQIVQAAHWFGDARAALSMWCQGLNQSAHGTHNNAALIHLHLATGQIGRPGAGPFSLTGQPNAMGGRETGAMANLLPGHRDLAKASDRAEVARAWGVPAIPDTPGLSAVELFDAVGAGRIKALWIACTNPAQSLPDEARVRAALANCEFVIVQDAFATTETAAYADVLLPAATWGEKEGTVTNSERRISRVRAAIAPPGEARADWDIVCAFAHRLGATMGWEHAIRMFPYTRPEQIFAEHAELTHGRDLDFSGLSYAVLDRDGAQQWPYPAGATHGSTRLYTDGRYPTDSGRARFIELDMRLAAEPIDARYPLALTTVRLRDQWHGMSRTGRIARLWNHAEAPCLDMHPADLARRGLAENELIRVESRRGAMVLPVRANADLRAGLCCLPMHWGGNHLGGLGINRLTLPATDPYSFQPELKHCAVRVERAKLPWRYLALRTEVEVDTAQAQALLRMAALARGLSGIDHVSLTLAGRDHPVVVLALAHRFEPPSEHIDRWDRMLGLLPGHGLYFEDPRRHIAKRALIESGLLVGVRLAGETAAGSWLRAAMIERVPAERLRRWLFAPVASAPTDAPTRGRIICNCHDVSERDITSILASGANLAQLQAELRCGTACGSCLPELRRFASTASLAA